MRELLRSMAKAQMKQMDVPHPCRKHDCFGNKKQSVFSMYWRECVGLSVSTVAPSRKKKRKSVKKQRKGRKYA